MYSEKVTVGKNTEYPLNGLLTFPDDLGVRVPAVVMVHGSGPSNMDEKVMKLTPFKDLAEGLARYGVASLRYDKRTFVYAHKMRKTDLTVTEETIDDAILAIKLLKEDPRIDPENIFILGHSMGAMLAPRIDFDGGNCRGLIMAAGTPYRLEQIVLRQLQQTQKANIFMIWIISLEYRIYAKKFENLYSLSDEEARKKKFAGNLSLYYFKEMGGKTAADYLLQCDKPVFIMQGEKDFQVLADVDFTGFQEMLKDKTNVKYKLYPGLNHLFVQGIYDDILKASREYSIERHIGDEVLKDIADFIKENQG